MIEHHKVKVAVVGCGVVATAYYLPYLMEHSDLIAVCDLDKERTAACARLFGAKTQYQNYSEMLDSADIDAVFVLTGPGTHAAFAIAAAEAGKHVLIQKPMATSMKDAEAIVAAVRRTGVKALIEPSANSPVDPQYMQLQDLVRQGVLGDVHWFSLIPTGPDRYGPGLGMNPYGTAAFYAADSGGVLFDYAYSPSQIATLLGSCIGVMGTTRLSVPEHRIVPEHEYSEFLSRVTDPHAANYWDVVLDLPMTEPVLTQAPDNVFCIYEMESGAIGCLHSGRIYHPALSGACGGDLQVFGRDGNLIMGGEYFASIISSRTDLLPAMNSNGWYRIPVRGDLTKGRWPQPLPGGFNYYHESSRHFLECIVQDTDPVLNVEWGRHITEMMVGALQSAETGRRYELTTRLPQ